PCWLQPQALLSGGGGNSV
ncbi:hypothetical protein BN1708_019473, partial [Verticillium longisporum]